MKIKCKNCGREIRWARGVVPARWLHYFDGIWATYCGTGGGEKAEPGESYLASELLKRYET